MRAALALFLVACGADTCPKVPPGYAADVAPLLSRSCLPCHSVSVRGANRQDAPRDANYDTYDDVVAAAAEIVQRTTGGGEVMPPRTASTPRLTAAEAATIRDWHLCGDHP